MRYVVLVSVAVMYACGLAFDYSELTNVKVSPTVVRAGDRFVASASVALHGDRTDPSISVRYDEETVSQPGAAVSHSFTAIRCPMFDDH
jgi:hypothetical protein